jgi:hypothetical protein
VGAVVTAGAGPAGVGGAAGPGALAGADAAEAAEAGKTSALAAADAAVDSASTPAARVGGSGTEATGRPAPMGAEPWPFWTMAMSSGVG